MQSRGAGSVLTEQTVLAFGPDPPSCACSPVLPACVVEGRGGETGFAMNQKTQLQFNLGVEPNQANVATRFNPTRPSPVVIERSRVKSETIGMSHTPVGDFNAVSPERLALAVKLAKRNARLCSPQDSSDERNSPVCKDMADSRDRDGSEPFKHESHLKPDRTPLKSDKGRTDDAVGSPAVVSIAKEITRLKIDLKKQLVKLNKANESKDHLKTPQVLPPASDRVYWQEPVDEGEERMQQRREEQLTRNARMIYDLAQQVKSLRKQFNKQSQQGVQPLIVQKLAAAQRAALRTLQGYCSHGRWANPIPTELSVLIQQLAVLSSKLGGGANSELDATLHQLMANLDNKEKANKSLQIAIDSPRKKYIWSREAISSAKRKNRGVLYSIPRPQQYGRHLGHAQHTHFHNHTFNSARRQQPFQPYTPPHTCEPPQSSTPAQPHAANEGSPVLYHNTHVPSHTLQRKKAKGRKKATATRNSPPVSPRPKKKKQVTQLQKKKKTAKVEFSNKDNLPSSLSPPPSSDTLEVDVGTAIAMQAHQLQILREEISQKLTDLRDGGGASARVEKTEEARRKLQLSSPPAPHAAVEEDSQSVESLNPRMSSMVKRLEQLEAEEETIRQRWNTIVYEDPLTTKPLVTLEKKAASGENPTTSSIPKQKEGTTLPVMTSKSFSHIEQYREQYCRYLNSTGVSTQGGFDPWKMAESIADDLLEELLEGVADEVEQVCDGCVDELFGNEFIRPP